MTKEQEEAIEYFKKFTIYTKNRAIEEIRSDCGNMQYAKDLEKRAKLFETVLNLIQEQQAEIEKKDKMIDEMAEELFLKRAYSIRNKDDIQRLKKQIIEEYERKVEE